MIDVEFFDSKGNTDGVAQYLFDLLPREKTIQLFAAVPGTGSSEFIPVEEFAGTPEQYLVHIVNPNAYSLSGSDAVTNFQISNSIDQLPAQFNLRIDAQTEAITVAHQLTRVSFKRFA